MLTNYLIIAIIVTGLGGAFATKLYINEASDHAVTTKVLEASEANFIKFKEDMTALEIRIRELREENQAVTLNNRITTRTLDDLRDREATVLAKKSLVALRINKAFQKRQNKLACTTGDFTLC